MRRKLVAIFFGCGIVIGHTLFAQAPAPQPAPVPTPKPAPVVPTPAPAPIIEPIAIKGDTTIPCYGFARIELVGTYSSAGWLCFPDRTTGAKVVSTYTANFVRPDKTAGSVYLVSGPPGAYDLGVFAVTPAGMQTLQFSVTIQPAAPAPQPTPTPGPTPTPTPTPNPNPPPLPGPNPTPQPNPTPTPKPPFPSTQLEPERWREFEPPRKTRKTRSTTPAKVVEFSHALYSVPVAYTPADLVRRLDQIQILLDRYFPED